MNASPSWRPATVCVRGALNGGAKHGPLVQPLVQSTTYAWPDLDHPPPVTYARSGNATVEALENRLAQLEGGSRGICFGSGLAAIDALLRSLPNRARVVVGRHVYGGTTRLIQNLHQGRIQIETVDTADATALKAALKVPVSLVLLETPSNPTLRIVDLRQAAAMTHEAGGLLAVDNTLLTPLYQRPLALGADVSIHSTTKYLEGHDATLGGAVVLPERLSNRGTSTSDGSLESRLRWVRKTAGAVLAPFEAWLTLQGIKTLHLRTAAQWASASRLVRIIARRPEVRSTFYPGLAQHPGHEIHQRQATGDGGIIGLDLGSLNSARTFVSSLRVFTLAENLGATESIATHPASMTHSDLPIERRLADGIPDGLVRLSVGVEDPEDLESDINAAFAILESHRLVAA